MTALARPSWTVAAAAAVAVLARLPFIGHAPGPDESGFLLVGAQWNGAGTSLYGDYWVDRPPLLITIFRLASTWGGVTALRLIGCLAVCLIVLGCARAAKLLAGDRASRWSAVTASALCVSPRLGGYEVNGELLAAPFVVGGILAVITAVRTNERTYAACFAASAGVLATCAVLVKQNFADVAVFGAVAFTLCWLQRDTTRRRFLLLSGAAIAGAAVALALAAAWTMAHGTSLRAVYDAMYPFRIRAGHVIASGASELASARLDGLLKVAATSGIGLLVVLAALDAVGRRRRGALSWALLVLLTFAVASVLLGGSYWHHYLLQLVVPVSVAAGVLAVERPWLGRPIVVYAAVVALVAWSASLSSSQGSTGQSVGEAIGAVSQPDDTIVNLYGSPDIVQASGLSSPYAYLWSLPIKTLDQDLTQLNAVLSADTAPTWLVTRRSVRTWGLHTAATKGVIDSRYRKVQTICDRTVYLRKGLQRAVPERSRTCPDAPPA